MPRIKLLEDGNSLQAGSAMVVEVNKKKYALYNANGEFFASDNECPHMHGSLGEGILDNDCIVCPLHGWRFNVRTGISPVNPQAKIRTYKTIAEGNGVFIEV